MEFGLTCPIPDLLTRGGAGDFVFLLAQYLYEDPQYHAVALDLTNDYPVVMDNGVFEKGKPLDEKAYFKAAEGFLKHGDVLVLPDVWQDKDQTLWNADRFVSKYHPLVDDGIQFMFVPQGKFPLDWLSCFLSFMKSEWQLDVDWVGVPKWLSYRNHGRMRDNVANLLNVGKEIHLLGCCDPRDLVHYTNEHVKRVDTSWPFSAAIYGRHTYFDDRGPHVNMELGVGEEHNFRVALNVEYLRKIAHNGIVDETF